jgi:glycosyltransferase involved in cell wall biosynthesis
MWMKWMGKVRTLVSVHSDHLPLAGSLPVRLHRRFNLTLNRFIARHADEVWRLSPRIPIGERHPHNYVVPVYINDNKIPLETRRDIVYVGIPSPDHALDVLFDVARRHDIPLHIVGDSPYLRSIQMLAPPKTEFHGYVTDPVQIREIVRRCFCGYAVYRNTGPENYSYYGIPSKPFHYFANNVPVLITNTAHFSQYIEKHGVGCVVPPDPEKIERAILEMQKRSEEFYLAITRFRVEWNQDTEKFIAKRMAALLA